MILLRIKNLSVIFSQRKHIACVHACNANFRRFASSSDEKQKLKSYGMVNNVRTGKLKKERPSLTIYPFSIDELKEPTQFHEAIDKNAKRTIKAQVQESLEKNTQNKMIEQTSTKTQQETEQIILGKNVASVKNIQQQQSRASDPFPIIVRQMQTSGRQKSAGSLPPIYSNPTLWFAAILLGGGAYVIYENLKGKGSETEYLYAKKPKIPASSLEIPRQVPYLLIGGGTASFSAFRAIKSHDPKAKIMVLSSEVETPYMKPPLSKELWSPEDSFSNSNSYGTESLKFKQWNGVARSVYYEPNDFYIHPSKLNDDPNGGVAIVRGYTVKKLDVENRVATLTDGTEITYQKCLIATGSTPKTLPVFEKAPPEIKERVTLFKTIDDYGSLKRYVDQSKSIAIIGGGFLGSELACGLAKYGENKKLVVHQVFNEPGNMGKVLPEFLSKWTTERIREEGVNVIPHTEIRAVDLIQNQIQLTLENGKTVLCDHVVLAVGSEPNISLAKESGLEVDTVHGGYLVNAELAARNNLYVAGDAACFFDPKLGRRRLEHHDHAVVSGRLAGENMVGPNKPYKHQSMFWSDLGSKICYEALGIVDSKLPTVSVFVKKPSEIKQSDIVHITASVAPTVQAADAAELEDDFSKGVIFYLKEEKIVGIVLWNIFNQINTARAIINQGKKHDDINEVAKLFDIHAK